MKSYLNIFEYIIKIKYYIFRKLNIYLISECSFLKTLRTSASLIKIERSLKKIRIHLRETNTFACDENLKKNKLEKWIKSSSLLMIINP